MLQFMGLQRVGQDWVTELNWTEVLVRVWRKRNLCALLDRNVNWYSHYGKQYRGFLKKQLIWSSNPSSAYIYSRKMKSTLQGDSCTPMFVVAVFAIAKIWQWMLLSHVWLFAIPWTLQSMEFSRPERNLGSPKMLQQVTLALSRIHYPLTKQWRWDLCFFSFEWNIPEWCMGSSR